MTPTSARRRCALLVFLAASVAYAAACTGTFLYDDVHSVRDNAALSSLANLPRLLVDPGAFSAYEARMWRPVLLVTLALNHAMGDGAALAFKLTDVLLHGLCAIALLSVGRALGARLRVATLAALVFAVHPLASEAVGFVSARSDQFLALGMLIAVRSHLAFRAGSRVAVLGTIGGMLLACGSKETGVVIPGVLLAVELVRTDSRASWWVSATGMARRLAPSVAVAVLYLVARRVLLGQATVALPRLTGGDATVGAGRDLVTQFCAMAEVLPRFLAQSVLPVLLTPDPPVSMVRAPFAPGVLFGWALVLALTACGLLQFRRRPEVFVGTVMAWAVALPWVIVPLNSPAGEHRFYGSLAGVLLAFAGGLRLQWLRGRTVRVVVPVLVLLFAVQATRMSLDFRDARTLWTRALAVDANSTAGLCGLAQVEQDAATDAIARGDLDAHRAHLRAAIEFGGRATALRPDLLTARRQVLRYRLGLGPEHGAAFVALTEARALVALRPKNPTHRILLSQSLTQAGTVTGAREFFDEAEAVALSCLEVAEPRGLVWRVAAEACVGRGDVPDGIAQLDAAIAAGCDSTPVRLDRVDLLHRVGRTDEARAELQRILGRSPFDARARALRAQLAAPPR